jgi:hypothetical protein
MKLDLFFVDGLVVDGPTESLDGFADMIRAREHPRKSGV